jgi:transcriptional regulator with XRE-family HTH domain
MEERHKPSELQQQLVELVDHAREDLAIEVKDWLDLSHRAVQANLARELLALANHGGGYLLFGFEDKDDGWAPSGPCPFDRKHYSQDDINGICERYAEPNFHCQVHALPSTAGNEHVVIRIPGGPGVPIRSRRGGPGGSKLAANTYYIRRPGPQSAPIAAGHEWDALLRRCIAAQRDELVEAFRSIAIALGSQGGAGVLDVLVGDGPGPQDRLRDWEEAGRSQLQQRISEELPDENPSRYAHGTWTVAYELVDPNAQLSLTNFMEILRDVAGHETGWPPWWVPDRDPIRPRAINDLIECWLAEPDAEERPWAHLGDAAHSDFWRGDPSGRMFLLRGYQEDGAPDRFEPGTTLDITLPVWRTGECLLHAQRLADRLGSERLRFLVRWDGLKGRRLASWNHERAMPGAYTCAQNTVTSVVEIDAPRSIGDTLPEIVRELVEPFFAVFDFFSPPEALYTQELSKMRKGV